MLETQKTKKAMLKCLPEYRSEFEYAKCSVTISVGQSVHEGEKFKAVLEIVNSSFQECTIMICDSLQRHTLKINKSINVHEQANSLGLEWLKRNEQAINRLRIKFDIIRWDYWLRRPEYKSARGQIDELFIHDAGFRKSIENTAKLFLARNINKLTNVSYSEALKNSYEYLLEECAVMLIWAEHNYSFEIYTSHRNSAMRYIYENIISKITPHLVREVTVKFK